MQNYIEMNMKLKRLEELHKIVKYKQFYRSYNTEDTAANKPYKPNLFCPLIKRLKERRQKFISSDHMYSRANVI